MMEGELQTKEAIIEVLMVGLRTDEARLSSTRRLARILSDRDSTLYSPNVL